MVVPLREQPSPVHRSIVKIFTKTSCLARGLSSHRHNQDGVLSEEMHSDQRLCFARTARSLIWTLMPATDRSHSCFRQFGVTTHYGYFFDRAVGADQSSQAQLSSQIRIRHDGFNKVTLW